MVSYYLAINSKKLFYNTSSWIHAWKISWNYPWTLHRRTFFKWKNINYNYSNLSFTTEEFEKIFETTIHEMIHIMGFSGNAIKNWNNPETGYRWGTGN